MDVLLDAHLYNALLMIAIPVVLGFYLTRRFGFGVRLWWIGAAGFVLSQVGHIPFNALLTQLFQNGVLPPPPVEWRLPFNALVLGLSAGLWEELTRAGIFRWWAKDARSWRKGVLLGAGHGGSEAILLGVLVLVTFFNMVVLRNMDLSQVVPPEQLDLTRQGVQDYWSAPWHMVMLGALERALTIPSQIAFSVLVLQAFTRGRSYWVALAVLYHTVLDAAVVYLGGVWAGQPWAFYALEGVIAVFAAISIALIFLLRRPEPLEVPAPAAAVPEPLPGIKPEDVQLEVTEEDLDRSRYT
jgi:uncharacterized membrane protein YhfC